MKGVIALCLAELVKSRAGEQAWETILANLGLKPKTTTILATQDLDDEFVMEVIGETGRVLGLSPTQLADAFGDYWVNVYSQQLYGVYYHGCSSVRELLDRLNDIHRMVVKKNPTAKPPRFKFRSEGDDTLFIDYSSHRGLIDVLAGLVRGLGRHYDEPLEASVISPRTVRVRFL